MSSISRSTQAFLLFCAILFPYYLLVPELKSHWGLSGLALGQILFLLLPCLILVKLQGETFSRYFPWRWPRLDEFGYTLVFTALAIRLGEWVIQYQDHYWPLPEALTRFYQHLMQYQSWNAMLKQILTLALIPAFCEELFFRGFLQTSLAQDMGERNALLLSALFFAIAHFNPWRLSYFLMMGLFFGGLRYWKQNLSLCVLAHFLNNIYSIYSSNQ